MSGSDLIVSTVTAPMQAVLNQSFSLEWIVTNQGTVTASPDWYGDYIFLSDDLLLDETDEVLDSSWRNNSELIPGGNYSLTSNIWLSGDTKLGDRYLLFVTDRYDNQQESDETNNLLAIPINLTAPDVDLVISNATAQVTPVFGEEIQVSWTATNQGSDSTITQWTDRVY
jgi:hypothetical protein